MNRPKESATTRPDGRPSQAAVAIIVDRDGRLLTIKRSATVRAPGAFCFPGGGIEAGETVEAALVREMQEELNLVVKPIRSVWQSLAPTGVELFWWLVEMAEIDDGQSIVPNQEEVESAQWLHIDEIRALPKLLASNVAFFESHSRGEFNL